MRQVNTKMATHTIMSQVNNPCPDSYQLAFSEATVDCMVPLTGGYGKRDTSVYNHLQQYPLPDDFLGKALGIHLSPKERRHANKDVRVFAMHNDPNPEGVASISWRCGRECHVHRGQSTRYIVHIYTGVCQGRALLHRREWGSVSPKRR